MFHIKQSTTGKRYLMDDRCGNMYAEDGTPMRQPAEARHWAVIGTTTSLFAWQRGEWEPSLELVTLREALAELRTQTYI